MAPVEPLPRPGLIGIAVRLTIGALVAYMGYGAIVGAKEFWDGYSDPIGSLAYVGPLAAFSSWVVNELLQKPWGWRPTGVLVVGGLVAIAAGSVQGEPFGPLYGAYVWAWTLAFSLLLAPAQFLAAALRTPGCEMRSFADLRARLRGGDPTTVTCPGWIDRFDHIRVLGRL